MPSTAGLGLMPLIRKIAHAWSWDQPGRNAAALRFIAAAEQYDIRESDLQTAWRVAWAKSSGPSEILARIDSFVSLDATRLNGRIAVVTAARPGRVDLWDVPSGQPDRLRYRSADVSVIAAGPAPDGSAFVSVGSEGGSIRSWQVRRPGPRHASSPAVVRELEPCDVGDAVSALAVTSVLGRPCVVAGLANGYVSLLDLSSGTLLEHRQLHDGPVTGISPVLLSGGVPAAVSVSVRGTIQLSHLRERLDPVVPVFRSGNNAIRAVATVQMKGGRVVAATAGDGGSLRLWDLPPEAPASRQVPGYDQDITALAAVAGPESQLLATGDSHGRLCVVDPYTARIVHGPVEGHRTRITGLTFADTKDGRSITVSGGDDGTVRSWDLAGGIPAYPPAVGPAMGETAGRHDHARPPAPPIRLWRLDDGLELGPDAGAHSHRMAAVATVRLADGTAVAVTDAGTHPQLGAVHGSIMSMATATLPGKRVVAVSASTDDRITFWDLTPCPDRPPRASGTVLHPGVTSVVTAVCADGRPVAVSAGRGRALKVWDIQRLEPFGQELLRHSGTVTALASAMAPGRPAIVVSGSADTTLRTWDVDAGQPFGPTVHGHKRLITAVAAAYAGDRLVAVTACREDAVARAWDLLAPDPSPLEFAGHDGPVTAVAIGGPPDRRVVVTGSDDQTLRVWDLRSADPLLDPMPIPGTVRAISCFDAPDPGVLIAGDDVLAVVRWKLK
ncbi:WD40 repeat domain-containing protein [Trebonia kvetii]|uniref:WD40 repeat domain-containing protein n=1 Tax=Trebonia kvetii TaxID=2480626 RepID=UPI00165214DE|nr:WD40 repeat domain-containing protein [Trebonia kvetii]